MSYYLPKLLYFDVQKLKQDIEEYEEIITPQMQASFAGDTALTRIVANLAGFYALGQHVSATAKINNPNIYDWKSPITNYHFHAWNVALNLVYIN